MQICKLKVKTRHFVSQIKEITIGKRIIIETTKEKQEKRRGLVEKSRKAY